MSTKHLEAARDLRLMIDRNATQGGKEPIPPETVEALVDADLFGAMSPREVGGAELSLLDAVDVFAEISRADGSTGWCLMAGACTIAYFGAYGAADFVDPLFARGIPIAAGQFAPNGTTALRDGPLQRCFRDIHAGSQHFFASPAATLDMARDLLSSAPKSALEA